MNQNTQKTHSYLSKIQYVFTLIHIVGIYSPHLWSKYYIPCITNIFKTSNNKSYVN
jgi:hypothetical protein